MTQSNFIPMLTSRLAMKVSSLPNASYQMCKVYRTNPYYKGLSFRRLGNHQYRSFVSKPTAVPVSNVLESSGSQHFTSTHMEAEATVLHDGSRRTDRSISICKLNPQMDDVSIFLKNSRNTLHMGLVPFNQEASIFIAKTGDILHYYATPHKNDTLNSQTMKSKKEAEAEDSDIPSKTIQSIEDRMWRRQTTDWRKLPEYYLMLSKSRLTALVVLTTMAGYGIAPGSFEPATFLLCSVGTALTSAAANAMNQYYEVPFDAQMDRTKNRVLVKGLISPLHAVCFGAISGLMGLSILLWGVNIVTASLGAFNMYFYSMVYTPLKRMSIANTWVGSVVGAIPPMMGWAASTGGLEPGAWLLAAIMYAWQFPHFNALSWNLRSDYSRGGYRMVAVVDPLMCKRVAFRYSLGMIGLCVLAPVFGVTTWTFAADSLPLNIYFSYLGWRFYRDGDSNSSRKLFRFSLIHLPLLLMLMMISKNFGESQKPKEAEEVSSTTQVQSAA